MDVVILVESLTNISRKILIFFVNFAAVKNLKLTITEVAAARNGKFLPLSPVSQHTSVSCHFFSVRSKTVGGKMHFLGIKEMNKF